MFIAKILPQGPHVNMYIIIYHIIVFHFVLVASVYMNWANVGINIFFPSLNSDQPCPILVANMVEAQ